MLEIALNPADENVSFASWLLVNKLRTSFTTV